MARVIAPGFDALEIPAWVVDFPSFLRWVQSGDMPEKPAVHFIDGEPWVDFSMEEVNSHNQLKATIHSVLFLLAAAEDLGTYFPDGMRLTNEDAEFSCEPDGMFVSHATLEAGGVTFRAGETTQGRMTEAVGTPDTVMEIISPSSEEKDTDRLFRNYHAAGIPEYWLIDGRGAEVRFDIYKRGAKGYTATRKSAGWVKSVAFGKSFHLVRLPERRGIARYSLEAR
jgi:Uma2 family endonuclease